MHHINSKCYCKVTYYPNTEYKIQKQNKQNRSTCLKYTHPHTSTYILRLFYLVNPVVINKETTNFINNFNSISTRIYVTCISTINFFKVKFSMFK